MFFRDYNSIFLLRQFWEIEFANIYSCNKFQLYQQEIYSVDNENQVLMLVLDKYPNNTDSTLTIQSKVKVTLKPLL